MGIRTGANNVTAVHLGALSGSGRIQRGANSGGAATLFIGAADIDSVFSGNIISAELSLEKTGTGTLTLNGATTYGGATTTVCPTALNISLVETAVYLAIPNSQRSQTM